MSEETNCPECGYRSNSEGATHTSTCSLIDLRSAKLHLKDARFWSELYSKRISVFMAQAQRWEGKFRIVCHENNQLRKKLRKEGK